MFGPGQPFFAEAKVLSHERAQTMEPGCTATGADTSPRDNAPEEPYCQSNLGVVGEVAVRPAVNQQGRPMAGPEQEMVREGLDAGVDVTDR